MDSFLSPRSRGILNFFKKEEPKQLKKLRATKSVREFDIVVSANDTNTFNLKNDETTENYERETKNDLCEYKFSEFFQIKECRESLMDYMVKLHNEGKYSTKNLKLNFLF